MDSRKYFIITVAVVAIVTGTWLTWRLTVPPAQPQTATVFPPVASLPDFSLLNHQGDVFSPASFEGHWNLVFFGFTHCPDICPLTLQVLANARRTMAENAATTLPRIVLVSVDPDRDTVQAIGQYVAHFGSDVVGVTGELAEIRKLTEALGIYFEKANIDADSYAVDHSAVVIVINPEGKFQAVFSAPHKAESFVHDLPIIMATQ
ncbi:MAG: SCO family protein [Woeseiaceae bacterium]